MAKKKLIIKITSVIARILFGSTFIFSSFVKAIDPIGFTYKIEDYLISFELVQLIPLALVFAILMILIEFIIGVFVILGFYRKLTVTTSLLFMLVVTPITLYIALENPVKDCGCFGDALIIDNWTTFYKNIVLLSLAILLYIYQHNIQPLYTKRTKKYVTGFIILYSLLFCAYNILYLPIIDFRPYKVGVNIPSQMEEDLSKGDVYENIYIYEKDGVEKKFTEENLPWNDSTWSFVDIESKLIKEAEEPLIQGFTIIELKKEGDGSFKISEDITNQVLSEKQTLLIFSLTLNDMNESGIKEIFKLFDYAKDKNIKIYCITASQEKDVENWDNKWMTPDINYASMDELTLKTIIRSNPGLVFLHKGIIGAKWSSRNIPNQAELDKIATTMQAGKYKSINNNSSLKLLILCMAFILPLLGLKWYDVSINKTIHQ